VGADGSNIKESTPQMRIQRHTGGALFDPESRIQIFLKPEAMNGFYGAVLINGRSNWIIRGGEMREKSSTDPTEIVKPFSRNRLTGLNDHDMGTFMARIFMQSPQSSQFVLDAVNGRIQLLYHLNTKKKEIPWVQDPSKEDTWRSGYLTLNLERTH
jgi:hypothetical protein